MHVAVCTRAAFINVFATTSSEPGVGEIDTGRALA
jgi:hypothetical protein